MPSLMPARFTRFNVSRPSTFIKASHLSGVLALASVFAPFTALAQPLVDQVPDDALAYIGWAGGDAMPAGYNGSMTQGLLEEAGLSEAMGQAIRAVLAGASEKIPEESAAAIAATVEGILPAVWSRPWAFYVGDIELQGGVPMPSAGLIIQPGVLRDDLMDALEPIFRDLANGDVPVVLVDQEPYIAILIGAAAESGRLPARPGRTLNTAEAFVEAAARAERGAGAPVLMAYANVEGVLEWMEDTAEQEGGPAQAAQLTSVLEVLGVDDVESVVFRGGFEDGSWATSAFLGAPSPRDGFFALADAGAADESVLAHVPASARFVSLTQFDPAGALELIQDGLDQIDEDASAQVMDMLDAFSVETQVDLEDELLAALGDHWLMYADESTSLGIGPGLVMINPLRDAAQLEASLEKLAAYATEAITGMTGGVPMGFETIEARGMTLHSVTLPIFSPTWTIHNDTLYVGLSAQAVATAVAYADQPGSILDNPEFQAARARLPETISSLSYIDLHQTAPEAYLFWTNLLQSTATMAGFETAHPMATIFPTVPEISPYLAPSITGMWSDDDGVHVRGVAPFMFSALLSATPEDQLGQMIPSLGIGVALPALGAARRTARQMQANNDVRQLAVACHGFAADHNGKFPRELAALVDYLGDDLSVYVSPMMTTAAVGPLSDLNEAELSDLLAEQGSYLILPVAPLDEIQDMSGTVLLVGRPSHFEYGRVPVGFADGHVELLESWEADEMVREQTDRTLYDWDENAGG